jgi:signal transduction histidine kinase
MFQSIRSRVTLTFILLAVIPVIFVGLVMTQQSFTAQQQEAIYAEQQVVQRVASTIESFIELRESELRLAADAYSLYADDGEEFEARIFNLLLSQNVYDQIIVTDATGQEQIHISRFTLGSTLDLENLSSEDVFRVPYETLNTYYGPVQFDDDTGEPSMTIAIPLQDLRSGLVIAVVIAEFRFRAIWNLVADSSLDQEALIYVVNRENDIIAHPNPSIVLQNTNFSVPNSDGIHQGSQGTNVVLVSHNIEFGSQRFTVISEVSVDTAFALAFNTLTTTLIVLVLTVVVAGGLGIWVAGKIVQPVEDLAQTAISITEGDFTQRAKATGNDEIAVLARAFNNMTAQLSQLIDNLEQRVQERTHDLGIAAEVSRQVTRVLGMAELLPYLTNLTKEGFELSHVSVFVYDKNSQTLRLQAGSGTIGEEMLQAGKHFSLDDKGLVPLAARSSKAQIINNVADSPDYIINPLLTETRSEMAIPMLVGTELIGVLDLQSNESNRFASEQANVLVALADQVAIAVRNADLFRAAESSRAEAEQANIVKSQFLANMSHELRTPLNAILNFTAFVADGVMGPVNDEQVNILQESLTSGRHLLALINDILDISKIEAGLMDLFIQEVDITEIINATASLAKGLVKDKSINLHLEVSENLPKTYGDKRRLRQVFLNLVSNAVKFTNQGEVSFRAALNDQRLHVQVQDTGVGIAPEDFELIFETFKQAKHNNLETVGTGLGLPISKYFIESHGGRMWLESEVGKGSTFFIELPILTEAEANAMSLTVSNQE